MTHEPALLALAAADPLDPGPLLVLADWLSEQNDPREAETRLRAALIPCLLDPAGDASRLAYADACEQVGQRERGEFVRVQVRLADPVLGPCACIPSRWKGLTYECEGCALRRRERELLTAANALAWGPDREVWAAGGAAPFCTMPGNEALVAQGYIGVEFRRGFPAHLTCTLEAFVGGECPECGGEGDVRTGEPHQSWETCWACKGQRRTPGLARSLGLAAPWESVTLSDMEPEHSPWRWFLDKPEQRGYGDDNCLIPRPLWDLMEGYPVAAGAKRYPTRALALSALGTAAVRWLRTLAGLPPDAPAGHTPT